jgi:hypothetical protein
MLDKLKDPMFPWQKIEDAPKDGTYVLLRGKSGYIGTPHRYVAAKCDREFRPLQPWVDCAGDNVLDDGEMPTHFTALDTPEKLAQALKIAVEALETINRVGTMLDSSHAIAALKQIEEALGCIEQQ